MGFIILKPTIWENMFYLFQASFSSQSKYGVLGPQLNLQGFWMPWTYDKIDRWSASIFKQLVGL